MFWLDLYTLNYFFSVGGLALLLVTIGLFADYCFWQSRYYLRWFAPYVWAILIVTTIGSVALSLVYSEYFGFVPCSLCWLQRIALYPQALFVIMAFRTKESRYFPLYSMALSVFGLGMALYHYVYRMLPRDVATGIVMPCLADGTGDCASKIIDEFGFVTFPFLSAVLFAFLVALYLHQRRADHLA